MKTRRSKIGTAVVIALLAAQPGVAWAVSDVSGSYLSYKTDLKKRDTGTYAGPTGEPAPYYMERASQNHDGGVSGGGGN